MSNSRASTVTPLTPTPGRWKQEDPGSRVILGSILGFTETLSPKIQGAGRCHGGKVLAMLA